MKIKSNESKGVTRIKTKNLRYAISNYVAGLVDATVM
jgi:hypothetical protein